MEFHLVNADPKYPRTRLKEPDPFGYIYIGVTVRNSRFPFVLPDVRRALLLKQLSRLAPALGSIDGVLKVLVFRAIVVPPVGVLSKYLKQKALHAADFDVIVLIETSSPDVIGHVQLHPAYHDLMQAMQQRASRIYLVKARNIRRINDFDTSTKGLFLFNHFVADDEGVLLELWDYLAGWYAVETGLTNSVALGPLQGEPSDYRIINWARWDVPPLRHFWHQLSKRSFRKYVLANLEANHAAAMPIYCRLA